MHPVRSIMRSRVMDFSSFKAPLRTNDSFRRQTHPDHHTRNYKVRHSPFEKLEDLDMVRAWPLDYMHLVCLGVMRKLLFLLMADMDEESQNEFDRRMKIFAHRRPSEFQRKWRPLSLLGRWKATEYRPFMLYAGPFVLKGIISDASYNNFLQLHFAVNSSFAQSRRTASRFCALTTSRFCPNVWRSLRNRTAHL